MSDVELPRVSLIAVGNELLGADRLETNCHEIQALLMDTGLRTARSAIVGDDADEIASEIRHAAEAADFVIITGGLGPTEDDVTREGAARAAGAALKEDGPALASIEEYFRQLGREMKPSNKHAAPHSVQYPILDTK